MIVIDGTTVIELIKVIVPVVIAIGGGVFAFIKYVDKKIGTIYKNIDAKFTRLEDILLNQNAKLNEMSGANQTIEGCAVNSRHADRRVGDAVVKLEEKLISRIEFEASRSKDGWNKLETRIKTLEDKK